MISWDGVLAGQLKIHGSDVPIVLRLRLIPSTVRYLVDLSVLEMAATSMDFIHQLPINSSPLLSSPRYYHYCQTGDCYQLHGIAWGTWLLIGRWHGIDP